MVSSLSIAEIVAKLLRDLNILLLVLNWFYWFSLKILKNLSCLNPIHVMSSRHEIF